MSSPEIPSSPSLRDVIARFGLNAKKSLGQHFLLDPNITDKIARAAGDLSNATVIEIGPGPGGLTRSLLNSQVRQVIAIERDQRCIEALTESLSAFHTRLQILPADALSIETHRLGDPPRFVIANLPYNIATPLFVGWCHHAPAYNGLVLMFQKEVADRLLASPGSKDYGRLSILTQRCFTARRIFDLPPRAFTPPPKVHSSVLHFVPRSDPASEAELQALEAVTKAAFQQRRKMLRQSLKSIFATPEKILAACGIDPMRRPEELSLDEFLALAVAWRQQ